MDGCQTASCKSTESIGSEGGRQERPDDHDDKEDNGERKGSMAAQCATDPNFSASYLR